MRELNKPFVIIALNRIDASRDIKALKKVGVDNPKWVQGVYKGESENAYIVTIPTHNHDDEVLLSLVALAHANDQDCILYCDGQRNAYFIETEDLGNPDHGKLKHAGRFRETTARVAHSRDGHTFADGRYFIID